MSVVIPPAYPILAGPVIFLAGPIQGAPDWQAQAIAQIGDRVHVASPRRAFHEGTFAEQVDWETHWLFHTAVSTGGTILFWLANQATEHPERVYAQTTRFELGEWLAESRHEICKVVVGIDSKFQGARYIRRRIAETFSHVSVFDNLEATVENAVRNAGAPPVNTLANSDWNEFHRLWTSHSGHGYDKSAWKALEARLLGTGRSGATENAQAVLREAERMARGGK